MGGGGEVRGNVLHSSASPELRRWDKNRCPKKDEILSSLKRDLQNAHKRGRNSSSSRKLSLDPVVKKGSESS